MGFLDKLWDETLAGPIPNTGLGRLRKYNPFSTVEAPNHPTDVIVNVASGDDRTVQVSRSITILRPKNLSIDPGSGPSTPSSGPSSPFSPGLTDDPDVKRFSRRKPNFDSMDHASPTTPTVYDWIMIGALDR